MIVDHRSEKKPKDRNMSHLKKNWEDMSPWLVHFTDGKCSKSAYDKMMGILSSQQIEAKTRYGFARKSIHCVPSACLSEIPLHQISRLAAERESPYGIVFTKDFIQSVGGGPILYAYKDSTQHKAVVQLREQAKSDASAPFWQIASFIDAPGIYGKSKYLFDWEREWRVANNIDFKSVDVAFLVIPEESHVVARSFFNDAEAENFGPNYQCPYVDPFWDLDRLKSELPD